MTRGCVSEPLRGAGRALAVLFILAAALMAFPSAGYAQQTARAKALGQKLMCVCGCNELLTACNHIGCTYSHRMLQELDDRIARGESDDLILQDFVQEYGAAVLAEPPRKGFDWLAWIAPVVVPLVALLLLWQIARRWRRRALLAPASGPAIPPEMLARARREADEESDE